VRSNAEVILRSIEIAKLAVSRSSPNPAVGCILTSPAGEIIGQGHTQQVGGPHAEIMALRDAQALGHDVRGATAYVTLEPCSHQGRTGPCCDALIKAGIAKVVASIKDPNPKVAGQGFARLRAAGVEVVVGPGAEESRELNIGFFSRMIRGIPWVRMKIAASLDGRTSLENGVSQWITSEPARADGHAWRARACVILTGVGTVIEDDPRLDVRLVDTPRQPKLVIVDSRLETPLTAALFEPKREVLIYTAKPSAERLAALQARGATVIPCANPDGKVDLAAMLRDLASREINEVHVESGHKLNGSLVREGLVDEFLIYLAPMLMGMGRGMVNMGPFEQLAEAAALEFREQTRIGPDLRILARVPGRDRF
jgi:diaminohydroxyphosphoribosylaminopyrimidine deaminase/5-amino-6-(5-phosphoribosylamino)uracil reductase